MEKIKLGIIGAGNMGCTHIESIKAGKCPDIIVTAVADYKPKRLEWVVENHPEIACFGTAESMMDSGLVNAVLVATPHYSHPQLAIECFKRKLHVMVEKPAGVYTKQVKEMNEAAAANPDVVFAIMFNQRALPVYQKIREIIKSGELGDIRRTSWIATTWYRPQAYYDSGGWRATWAGEGGGILINQCPHQLDLFQWICGAPTKVRANCHFGKWHDIEVEDDVTAYFEYENGATGIFVSSTGDSPGFNRLEITCEKGTLLCENGKLTIWKLEKGLTEFSKENTEPFANPKSERIDVEIPSGGGQHVGVLNAFANSILRGTPLIARGEEGIYSLAMSNAMYLSTWLDKTIDLPIDEDLYYEELMKRVKTSRHKKDNDTGAVNVFGTHGS